MIRRRRATWGGALALLLLVAGAGALLYMPIWWPTPEPSLSPPASVGPATAAPARPVAPATGGPASPTTTHRSLSVLERVPTSQKAVALTIDLGETCTPAAFEAILASLEKRNLHATWFLTGWFLRTYPDLARRLAAGGHELGNHTDTHPHCPRISSERLRAELTNVEELLRRLGLALTSPRYFRPPFGEYDRQVTATAGELGYRTVMWTATSLDYDPHTDPDQARARILRGVEPGAILLMHATDVSRRMLPDLLDTLQERGYQVLPLGEMVRRAETE